MFTIQQATGNIKKVDSIDQLIIEYIKQFSCKCNQNISSEVELKDYVKIEQLDELRNYLQNMCLSTENKLSVSINYYVKLTSFDEYKNS